MEYPVLFPVKRGDFARVSPSAFVLAPRFWGFVKVSDGCWMWTGQLHPKGYGKFNLLLKRIRPRQKRNTVVRASRMSWLLTRGEIPFGIRVLHRCDNPGCVRPDHLFLGTDKDNYEDAVAKGRRPPGIQPKKVKVT